MIKEKERGKLTIVPIKGDMFQHNDCFDYAIIIWIVNIFMECAYVM